MKEEKNISEVTQKLNNEEQTTNYEYAPNVNQITAAEVKEKVAVAQVYKADIVSSFLVVPELIKEGAIESGAYYKDLLMLYVFTAIGAVPVIKNQIKGK